ncbi:MAG TPA: FAD-dependent oxidoreductase [Gammaproteobacteria bacterium]|nr:FAD-dependent oxidoreductase [Gammaproteobacteria bacterium]
MEHAANITCDVLVIGAGPAGVVAALRAADLGAKATLVARDEFGGMAANDGPIPVRTLARAARMMRDARRLADYGIGVGAPSLDYSKLLERARNVVADAREHSSFRAQLQSLGATVLEKTGAARFVNPHTVETASGTRVRAERVIGPAVTPQDAAARYSPANRRSRGTRCKCRRRSASKERHRPEDIPLLTDAFLETAGCSVGRPGGRAPETRAKLLGYAWPGNVRELHNAVERAVILCGGGHITSEHLPVALGSAAARAYARAAALEHREARHRFGRAVVSLRACLSTTSSAASAARNSRSS